MSSVGDNDTTLRSCQSENKMNELSECGSESTEDSNDILWETIKVDLGLNRACQTEQLQSLKGSSVKLSPKKRILRKLGKRRSIERTRFHSEKVAMKTALGMIRAVNRNMKFRRRVAVNHNHTSVLNFKVFDNSPKTVGDNELRSSPVNKMTTIIEDCGNKVRHGPTKHEATQTKPLCLEDKSLQTDFEKDADLHFCDIVNACITMQPKPCRMGCHPTLASCCCPKPVINVCHCSVSHKSTTQTEESPSLKQVPLSDKNISTQFTLKQICEELLVQLSTRRNILSDQPTTDKNNETVKECSSEPSTGLPVATVSDLKAIVHSLQGIQNELKNNIVSHQFVVPTNITIARTETRSHCVSPVQSKAMALKPSLEEEQRTPHSTTDPALSRVTPDLLQLAGNSRFATTSTPTEDKHQNLQPFKPPFPENNNQQKGPARAEKLDLLQTIDWSSLIPLEENSDKLLQQMLDAGLVTIINSHDKTENIPSNVNQNETFVVKSSTSERKTGNNNDYLPSSKLANSIDESSKESSGTNSTSDDFALVLEMEESDQNMTATGSSDRQSPQKKITPGTNNNKDAIDGNELQGTLSNSENGHIHKPKLTEKGANSISSVSSSSDVDVVGTPRTSDEELAKGASDSANQSVNHHLTDLESKVLTVVNGRNSPVTEMIMDSVAFEEVDTSEMENILMIWRQQEQLHQDRQPNKSPSAEDDFLANMSKRIRELPSELKNVRVLQPPPLRKLQQLGSMENEPSLIEEDDVPEISPAVLPTPKKRRLSLKKNPPSPLAVVFHTSMKTAESLKTSEKNQLNDKGHSSLSSTPPNPAQVKEFKESTLDDDDIPLHTRMRKRKMEASTVKTQSVSGSLRKQDIGRNQTTDKISITQKKKSKKGQMENLEKPTESPKIGKSEKFQEPTKNSKKCRTKNVKEPSGNSKTDQSKNVEESADKTKKGDSTKGRKKTMTYDEIVAMAQDMHDTQNFQGQIKERFETLNKQWLEEKTAESKQSLPVSPALSAASAINGEALFEEKMQKLREISVYELGKAHDTAITILLNPWRGINARRVTRDYEPHKYDNKSISRCLWDLRSGADPDDIVNRIMSMGWEGVELCSLKTMVSMFVLSLARSVSFIIEAAKPGEEDDTSSIVSDLSLNQKKKATSARVVATRHIFKGECIEGLNGLLLKLDQKDSGKDRLKTWVFPKFRESRSHVILGPLAYLKRKEGNSNTEALFIKGDIITAKATRQILCGERLLVSYKRLQNHL